MSNVRKLAPLLLLSFLAQNLYLPASAQEFSQALALYQQKEFKRAIPFFQKAQYKSSTAAKALYYEALCYHHLGNWVLAQVSYRRVVKDFPNSQEAKSALAVLAKLNPKSGVKQALQPLEDEREAEYKNLPAETKVSYEPIAGDPRFSVPVKINGVSTKMMFDTGAAVTICPRRWLDAQKIKVKTSGRNQRLGGILGDIYTKTGTVKLTVGAITRTMPVYVVEDSDNNSNTPPLLGQTFFKDFEYQIDTINRTLHLKKLKTLKQKTARAPLYKNFGKNAVPYYQENNHIILTVEIEGRECEMILDTGDPYMTFSEQQFAQLNLSHTRIGRFSGGNRSILMINTVKIGSIEKHHVPAVVYPSSPVKRPILGQAFLEGLKYTLDPVNHVINFENPYSP